MMMSVMTEGLYSLMKDGIVPAKAAAMKEACRERQKKRRAAKKAEGQANKQETQPANSSKLMEPMASSCAVENVAAPMPAPLTAVTCRLEPAFPASLLLSEKASR